MRIAIVANSAWYLANFRLTLFERLRSDGHEVVAISPADRNIARITSKGFRHVEWLMAAASRNPWREWLSIRQLTRLLEEHDVEVVFSYTPKANIYSGLALRGRERIFVPNVSGLGYAFVKRNPLARLVKRLYGLSFSAARQVFFQNESDRTLFTRAGLIDLHSTTRLPGSGVDLYRFTVAPLPLAPRRILLFVGRMLADKGVLDLIEATRRLTHRQPEFEVWLLGPSDASHPNTVSPSQIESWIREGVVRYLGETDDVRPVIAQADAVVLPSVYREGVPRSLLEAAAMGRPTITYDMPGCRDAVSANETGWICASCDVAGLTAAIEAFMDTPPDLLRAMGVRAREKMEEEFDEEFVLQAYLRVVTKSCNQSRNL
jgi:glycosyltransferase involved in cell wall biosynthesis